MSADTSSSVPVVDGPSEGLNCLSAACRLTPERIMNEIQPFFRSVSIAFRLACRLTLDMNYLKIEPLEGVSIAFRLACRLTLYFAGVLFRPFATCLNCPSACVSADTSMLCQLENLEFSRSQLPFGLRVG